MKTPILRKKVLQKGNGVLLVSRYDFEGHLPVAILQYWNKFMPAAILKTDFIDNILDYFSEHLCEAASATYVFCSGQFVWVL